MEYIINIPSCKYREINKKTYPLIMGKIKHLILQEYCFVNKYRQKIKVVIETPEFIGLFTWVLSMHGDIKKLISSIFEVNFELVYYSPELDKYFNL